MRIEKKKILKEDGRTLIFYHFADTASETQQKAFQSVQETKSPTADSSNTQGDGTHV